MRDLVVAISVLIIAFTSSGVAAGDLAEIRKIYLGDFGTGEGADLVREKVRLRLIESGRFIVVEAVEGADAVLTGAAGVTKGYRTNVNASGGSGNTTYHGYGVLRLVDLRTQEPIWFYQYKRGFSFGSRSSRVAKQIVNKLLKDAAAAGLPQGTKQGEPQGSVKKP